MSDINLIIQATDKATPVLKRVNKQVDKFNRKAAKATKSGNKMGGMMKMAGAAALALGLTKVATSTVAVINEFDSLKAMLKTVTGSADGALVAFEQIKKFTADTPFQLAEVTNAFSILKRNGLDTTTESLTAFGNIAAANGKTFEQFAEALGDAVTGEFERMKEFGIKVKKEGDQMVAFMGSTQIGVSDSAEGIIDVFKKLGEEGGRYATGLADQAATIGGKWSNLQDALAEFAYNLGVGGLKTVLIEVTESMTGMIKNTGNLANILGAGIGAAIKTVLFWFSSMGEMFGIVYDGIRTTAVDLGNKIKEPVHKAVGKIGEIFAVMLEKAHTAFSGVQTVVKDVMNRVINTFIVFFQNAKAIITNLPDIFSKTFDEVTRVVPMFATSLIAQLKNMGEVLFHNFKVVVENFPEILKAGFQMLLAVVTQGGPMLIRQYVGMFKTIIHNAGVVLKHLPKIFGSSWTAILNTVVSFGKSAISKVKNIGLDIYHGLAQFIIDLPQVFTDAFKRIGENIKNWGKSVVDQAVAIGTAFKEGFFAIFTKDTMAEVYARMTSKFEEIAEPLKLAWSLDDKTQEELFDESPVVPVTFDFDTMMQEMESFKNEFKALEIDMPSITGLKDLKSIENFFEGKNWSLDTGIKELLLDAEAVADIMNQDRVGEFLSEEWVQKAIGGLKKMGTLAKDISGPGIIKKFMSEYDRLVAAGVEKQKALEQAIKNTEVAQSNLNETLKDQEVVVAIKEQHQELYDMWKTLGGTQEGWTNFSDKAKDALTSIKSGLEGLADNMTSVFYNMFTGVTSVMDGLRSMANMVFEMIAQALIKYYIVQPLIGALTGCGGLFGGLFGFLGGLFHQGGLAPGGKASIVGENGPEIIAPAGNTRVFSNAQSRNMLGGSGGDQVVINFNVSAIDTQSGGEFIMTQENAITGLIQEAFNRRGRQGPYG